jgi:Escherichia/Staphylococcus phage prohead protease
MRKRISLIKTATVNDVGTKNAAARIAAGDVDKTTDWAFDAADGDKLLGEKGDDWGEYAKWFLATNADQPATSKGHYSYPFGKNGKVYRSALIAIRSRAAEQHEDAVFDAAGEYLAAIDGEKAAGVNRKAATAMRQRAFAKLELKSVNDEMRILEGIATTPTPDRMGDVVEPDGAQFALPIPFLFQHDSEQPIGEVTYAKATKDGINVRVQLAKVDEPGLLKDRLDLAWQSIKAKLVRGLSIGFAPVEYSYLEDSGGYRFIKWMWLELSAVTIPANAEASIATIKSCDAALVKKRPRINLKADYPPMKISTPPRDEPIEVSLRRAAARHLKKTIEDNTAIHDEIAASRK